MSSCNNLMELMDMQKYRRTNPSEQTPFYTLTVPHLVTEFPNFMEPKVSSPCAQQPNTIQIILKTHFHIILSSTPWSWMRSPPKTCTHLFTSMRATCTRHPSWFRHPSTWIRCCVFLRYSSLRQADHSSRGVLPTVVRPCVWSQNLQNEGLKLVRVVNGG